MATFILLNSMVNKHLYSGILIFILAFNYACKEETKCELPAASEQNETVITSLIKSTVIVEDTSFNYMMKKDSAFTKIYRGKDSSAFKSLVNSITYLPALEFANYKEGLFEFLKNERTVITDKELTVLKDAHSRRKIFVMCDSIEFTDEPNKPKAFMCDSTSTFMFITGFDFYEKWSIEKASGNIKKDVLAYSPVKYNDVQKKFLPLFFVFKDAETFEKIKTKIKN